jgi:hypothetical protein
MISVDLCALLIASRAFPSLIIDGELCPPAKSRLLMSSQLAILAGHRPGKNFR